MICTLVLSIYILYVHYSKLLTGITGYSGYFFKTPALDGVVGLEAAVYTIFRM